MATFIIPGDKNFDTFLGASVNATLDTYAVNGASLTIDTDTRYCAGRAGTTGTACNGSLDSFTISAALGGTVFIDGTKAKIIPYKTGSGTTPAQSPALAITVAVWSASVVTITTAAHSYATGDWVAIGGLEPNGYNGLYQVTVTAATTFTYELAADPGISNITNGHAVKYLTCRQALAAATNITGGSWSSGVTTVTAVGHGLVTNDWVLIASTTPALYNGYWKVTGYTPNTFTYTQLVTPGAWSSGGTTTKTVQGFFLGCWSAFNTTPIPTGTTGAATVPAIGYIKVKGITGGSFTTGALTIQGGSSPLATSIGPEMTGWIEVVGAGTALGTVPRLGRFTTTGEWFYPRLMPKTSTSITRVGTTATLTLVGHLVTTGSIVTITGAAPSQYNGTYTVQNVTANTFDYIMASDPGSSAGTQGDFTTQVCTSGVANQQIQLPASQNANNYYAGCWIERSTPRASTYTWAANVVTVTLAAHGYVVGQKVEIDFTSGAGTPDGEYAVVSVPSTGTFTVALTGSGTGGNCTVTAYDFYPSAGSLTAAGSVAVNTSVGRVCWISAAGVLRIGSDGTNTNGYLPSSGCRIRVPNIVTINATRSAGAGSGTNALPSATIADRWEFATTGGGVVSMDKVNSSWYMTFVQAFSLTLTNVGILENLTIQELASPITLNNVGVGQTAAQLFNPLLMSLCFAGGTMANCVWAQATAIGTGVYGVLMTDVSGLTITNEIIKQLVFRAHATTGICSYTRVNNCTWTNRQVVGGRTLATTCSNLTFTTTSYADRIDTTATTATFTHYTYTLTTNCNTITIDGLDFFGLANRNPYLGLVTVIVGTSNVKLINVGTPTAPLSLETSNGCAYIIASAASSGCSNIEVKRVYTSTPRTGMQNFDNSISGVIYESVWAGSGVLTTGLPIASLNTQARGLINGYYPQTNAAQTSVYGTHFMDYFDYSTAYSAITAGEIIIACNEKTGVSPSSTTYTPDSLSAKSGFNSADVLQIPTSGDQVTWTSPTKIRGHTAFRAELPAIVGPATGVSALTITAGLWAGGVTTITCGTHKLAVGDTITITAVVPVLYNGTFVVSAVPSATQVSYPQPTTPGAWSSAGSVAVPYLAITAATWAAGYSSITTVAHGLVAGDTITVVGASPVGWNGTFVITNVVSATQVRYAQAGDPGAWVSGGTIRVSANIDLYYDLNTSGVYKNLRFTKKDCVMASAADAIITMGSTTGLAVDDYIFGDGVGTAAKILTIDSPTQITATVNNASTSTWPRTCYFSHLPMETVADAAVGFYLKVRAKTNANNNTAALTYIDIPTTATYASIQNQYPLVVTVVSVVLQNVVVGSTYRIETTDPPAGVRLFEGTNSGSETPPTTITNTYTHTGSNVPVKIIVRKSSGATKYLPFEIYGTITSAGLTTYVSQVEDTTSAVVTSVPIGNDWTINYTDKRIYHVQYKDVINASDASVAEVTDVTVLAAADISGGDYFNLYSAKDATAYYVWYQKDGSGSNPVPAGKTEILVSIATGNADTVVATQTRDAINTIAGADFTATASGAVVTITNDANGSTTDASDSTGGTITGFTFTVTTQGKGKTIWSTNAFYTWVQDEFDATSSLDDLVPMSAQTPTEYSLINGWFIDEESIKFLKSGSLKTSGWATSNAIRIVPYTQSVQFVAADIGRTIAGTNCNGKILFFDTVRALVWVRPTAVTDTFPNTNAYTVTGGTGVGTVNGTSLNGENIWANIYTLGTLVSNTNIYVIQNSAKIAAWWPSGHIDILTRVKEGGSLIDRGYLTVAAREYTTLYDHYILDASLGGRNAIPLAAFSDTNNTTGVRTFTGTGGSNTFNVGNYIYFGATWAAATKKGAIRAVDGYTLTYYPIGDLTDFTNGNAIKEYTGTADGDATCTAGTPADAGPALLTGITVTFSATSHDLGNGHGPQPYDATVDCNAKTLKETYERLKYITRRGSTIPLNGHNGEQYKAVGDIRFDYDTRTVTDFIEGEKVTAPGGLEGYIVSLIISTSTTGTIVLRDVIGTFADNTHITGAGTAQADINGTPSTIDPVKQAPFGTFAGGQFFGARGVWLTNYAESDSNNFELIDSTGTSQAPPTTVLITVSSIEAGDRVSVFRTTGNNEIVNKSVYTSHATNNDEDDATFEIVEAIDPDTPSAGTLRVVSRSASGAIESEETYDYVSWTGSVFTLSGTLSKDYDGNDTAYVPFIDKEATDTSVSVSVSFYTDRYVVTRVRKKGIIPFNVKGQLISTGLPVTAIRTEDIIVG